MSSVSPTESEAVTTFCNLTASQQEQIIKLMYDLIKSNQGIMIENKKKVRCVK